MTGSPAPAPRLVLASSSAARHRLLTDAGIVHDLAVSGVDEDAVTADGVPGLVLELARRKAGAVAATLSDGLVLGCDSLFELDGEALGKPAGPVEAVARLRALRGRDGVLHTGHCLVEVASGRRAEAVASTTVRFGRPSDAEIDAYVATGEPLGVAGGVTLEGRSAPFIDGIVGDHSNVIGLSLPLLRTLLAELGVPVTSLWSGA